MGRAKHNKASKLVEHYCGMCDFSFHTRGELNQHVANHADNIPLGLCCSVCSWPFDDSHLLEQHLIQSGHGAPQFVCDNCDEAFISSRGLDDHMRLTSQCQKAPTTSSRKQSLTCDRCPNNFSNKREYEAHRSFPNGPCADHKKRTPPKKSVPTKPKYIDLDPPGRFGDRPGPIRDFPLEYDSSGTPDDLSEGDEYCHDCKEAFRTKASFNLHALRCSSRKKSNMLPPYTSNAPVIAGKPTEALQPVASAKAQRHMADDENSIRLGRKATTEVSYATHPQTVVKNAQKPTPTTQTLNLASNQVQSSNPGSGLPSAPSIAPATTSSAHVCKVGNCGKSFKSAVGLKAHHTDIHGIGGKALDIHGSQSFMLNPRVRDKLKAEGLLRGPSESYRRGVIGGCSPSASTKSNVTQAPRLFSAPTVRPTNQLVARKRSDTSSLRLTPPQLVKHHSTNHENGSVLASSIIDGAAEMEQAKCIQGQILRILSQSDVFIQHNGKMTVGGIDWVRIPVSKQDAAAKMLDGMCHLPRIVQNEYLPPPQTFKDEYTALYPVADFKHSPEIDSSKPCSSILALYCSKVVLIDGRQEIVKIAAIDLMTCRILMNHLVCTNSSAKVANWRSSETGLSSWRDIEEARQAGYKVFKGWSATRSALWKFVDKDTVIVGYNLRSDLDALRMIHGRAVDIAKVVEKAAKGPLSKVQISLDSLCRTYLGQQLKGDPAYGRDCLVTAFAVRELGLWVLKNQEKLDKDAKQKSLDFQKVTPKVKA